MTAGPLSISFAENITPSLADLQIFAGRITAADRRARYGQPVSDSALPERLLRELSAHLHMTAWMGRHLAGLAVLARLGDARFELAILVRSDLQRRGIGTGLAGAALLRASALNASVFAQTTAANRAALRLLHGVGFSLFGDLGHEVLFVAKPYACPSHSFRGQLPRNPMPYITPPFGAH